MARTRNIDIGAKESGEMTTPKEGTHEGRYHTPEVDIYETDASLVVVADMPGASAEDFEIDLRDNLLTISANVDRMEGDWEPVYEEYEAGHYMRQFRVGHNIDRTNVTAKLKNGVLELTLPKAQTDEPRKIEIKEG